jgi:hypothetical protein
VALDIGDLERLEKNHRNAVGLLSAALALFAIMALTFFDVGGRKLLSNSIPARWS